MTTRRWNTLLALIVVLTAARVMTTHRVFSQTSDEPYHLAAGYDVLTKGTYTIEPEHPPLARIIHALPFINTPEPASLVLPQRGNELLLRNDRYTQNLARARLGNLLFLALGIIAVAVWARQLFSPSVPSVKWAQVCRGATAAAARSADAGDAVSSLSRRDKADAVVPPTTNLRPLHGRNTSVGLLAALLYASLPPVLAHAGFATTDMAGTAIFTLAVWLATRFLDDTTWKNTILFALVVAAGVLAKYSFIVYFPPAFVILAIVHRRAPLVRTLVAILGAFVIVWAAFGFSIGTCASIDPESLTRAKSVFGSTWFAELPVPAPRVVNGILVVKNHDFHGHPAFLFGEKQWKGWWYYFPLALFYKTPIPFLVLAIAGCVLVWMPRVREVLGPRRRPEIALIAAATLAVAMTSHINIGVRHVLPIYAPLAIAAAFAIVSLPRFRWVSAALVAWLLIGVAAAHPDYLPWFNAAAGRHPENILSDSNLDWGQDTLRLVRTARKLGIDEITLSLFTTADLDRIGLPRYQILQAMSEVNGWLAISEMNIAQGRGYSPEVRVWLDALLEGKPYQRIGKSIRLYDFRPRR